MHQSTDQIRLQLAAERNQERNYKINYRNITTLFLFFLMMLLFVCFEKMCFIVFRRSCSSKDRLANRPWRTVDCAPCFFSTLITSVRTVQALLQ